MSFFLNIWSFTVFIVFVALILQIFKHLTMPFLLSSTNTETLIEPWVLYLYPANTKENQPKQVTI